MKYTHSEFGQFGHRFQVQLTRDEVESLRRQVIEDLTQLNKESLSSSEVEKKFSTQILETTREKILFEAFSQILTDQRLAPCAPVNFTAPNLQLGSDYSFIGEFEIKPTIKALNTDGVVFMQDGTSIDDLSLQREVQRLLMPFSTARDLGPQEKAKMGSLVLFDIVYKLNGLPLMNPDGTPSRGDQRIGLILGRRNYKLPLDEFFVGMKAGETKNFEYQIPQIFNVHEIAGKKAEIQIKVLKVQELQIPELNDAFVAKQFGSQPGAPKTAAEFKKYALAQLQNRISFESFNKQKGLTLLKLVELNPFPIPVSLLAAQKKSLLAFYEKEAQSRGKWVAPAPDSAQDREIILQAANIVRAGLIIEFLADKHGLRVSHEDIENHLQNMAKIFGTTPEYLRSKLNSQESKNQMTYTILENKVVDLFKKSA